MGEKLHEMTPETCGVSPEEFDYHKRCGGLTTVLLRMAQSKAELQPGHECPVRDIMKMDDASYDLVCSTLYMAISALGSEKNRADLMGVVEKMIEKADKEIEKLREEVSRVH